MKAFKIIVPIYIICFLLVASLGAVIVSKAYAAKTLYYQKPIEYTFTPPVYPVACKTLILDYYTDAKYKDIVSNADKTTVISGGGLDNGGVSMFYESSNTTAYVLKKTDIIAPVSCKELFRQLDSLTTIKLYNFNTSDTTDMSYMFYQCYELKTLEFSAKFDCQNVTTMANMFCHCDYLTTIQCSGVDANVIDFKTSTSLQTTYRMFFNCEALPTLKFSANFETSGVTIMREMFIQCHKLTTLDVTNFNTENVTSMSEMFYFCNKLTKLDLSSFNTKKVTTMFYMFGNCKELTTIYVGGGWSIDSVTRSDSMFYSCSALTGGKGTKVTHTDKRYARVDGGPSAPGYFSEKPATS